MQRIKGLTAATAATAGFCLLLAIVQVREPLHLIRCCLLPASCWRPWFPLVRCMPCTERVVGRYECEEIQRCRPFVGSLRAVGAGFCGCPYSGICAVGSGLPWEAEGTASQPCRT